MQTTLSDASLKACMRVGGALYLLIIVSGLFGELAREGLVQPGDALATLANIRAAEGVWRGFLALNLLHLACSLPLAMVFYVLLKPSAPRLVILVLLFNVSAVVLEAGSKLFLLPALFFLGGAEYLQAFSPEQQATLAYLGVRLHGYGFSVSLIFFGFECVLLGFLLVKARYCPTPIGALMVVAGVCYLSSSFILLLVPSLSNVLLLIPCLVAELSLALWLLFRGPIAASWRAEVV